MKELNNWHPYPRYGVAAAMVETQTEEIDLTDKLQVRELLIKALDYGMTRFLIMRKMVPPKDFEGKLSYTYLSDPEKVDPGSKSGQNASNGYYTAPHVLAPNNSAALVKEIKAIKKALLSPKYELSQSYELKRSFAPLIAKINSGKPSMSNPKVGIMLAGFTMVATLTSLKAATYDALKGGGDPYNIGVIPDLPYYDEATGHSPLKDFVKLFEALVNSKDAAHLMEGRYAKKFYRPNIFQGNFPNALQGRNIGAISLMVAVGEWIKEASELAQGERSEYVRLILDKMVGRPLYLVSNAGAKQESFGHHLVGLTLKGEMKELVQAINTTRVIGEDGRLPSDSPKVQQFRMMADRFLLLFTAPSFRDFMAYRAEYPRKLFPLLNRYFLQNAARMNLTPDLIKSAREYGQSLNRAAYIAANNELKDDVQKGRKGVSLSEYKDKFLTQFESTIGSSTTGTELISRLSTIAGRITKQEIRSGAIPFMEAVALGEEAGGISVETGKQLITAFMRVSSYDPSKQKENEESASKVVAIENSTANDEMPTYD